MANVSLCTSTDVSDWWSPDGVLSRLDDDYDNANNATETEILGRVIESASIRVIAKIGQRYKTSDLTGSNAPTDTPQIVRYFTSVVAAYLLSIRRGMAPTQAFLDLYNEVMAQMEEVAKGQAILPGVYNSLQGLPFVNNYHVDGRYHSAKVRRVFVTSTAPLPSPARAKYHPEYNTPNLPE